MATTQSTLKELKELKEKELILFLDYKNYLNSKSRKDNNVFLSSYRKSLRDDLRSYFYYCEDHEIKPSSEFIPILEEMAREKFFWNVIYSEQYEAEKAEKKARKEEEEYARREAERERQRQESAEQIKENLEKSFRSPLADKFFNEFTNSANIKQTYRRLAKEFHPDVNGGDKESFQLLTEVYELFERGVYKSNPSAPQSSAECSQKATTTKEAIPPELSNQPTALATPEESTPTVSPELSEVIEPQSEPVQKAKANTTEIANDLPEGQITRKLLITEYGLSQYQATAITKNLTVQGKYRPKGARGKASNLYSLQDILEAIEEKSARPPKRTRETTKQALSNAKMRLQDKFFDAPFQPSQSKQQAANNVIPFPQPQTTVQTEASL